eukprot:SAG31_NODE_1997_length_6694_cov_12.857056_3_plen_252_part_00
MIERYTALIEKVSALTDLIADAASLSNLLRASASIRADGHCESWLRGDMALSALLSHPIDVLTQSTLLHMLAFMPSEGGNLATSTAVHLRANSAGGCSEVQDPLAAMSCLLRNGADPTAWTKKGLSPLHGAAAAGNAEACRLLMAYSSSRARVWSVTVEGANALHMAALHGHAAVAKMLMDETDCCVDSAARGGATAVHIAASHGHFGVLSSLLCPAAGVGADPNKTDGNSHAATFPFVIHDSRLWYAIGM